MFRKSWCRKSSVTAGYSCEAFATVGVVAAVEVDAVAAAVAVDSAAAAVVAVDSAAAAVAAFDDDAAAVAAVVGDAAADETRASVVVDNALDADGCSFPLVLSADSWGIDEVNGIAVVVAAVVVAAEAAANGSDLLEKCTRPAASGYSGRSDLEKR